MVADIRYALRTLWRSPAFTLSAILALALGIGANTAVFSVVYAVLLKPPPYFEPSRLVRLSERNAANGIEQGVVSSGTFVDWRSRARTLESAAVYAPLFNGETIWEIDGRPQIVKSAGVSPAIFDVLGIQPIVGGGFRDEASSPPPGAMGQFVISYGLWRRAFGGTADVVGRQVLLEGRLPRVIVGVMPPGFGFPDDVDAWTSLPLGQVPTAARRARSFNVIARMARGRTIADVSREIAGISRQLETDQPASNAGWTAAVEPFAGSDSRRARLALLALLAAVAGVLLIACANVANLLLARAAGRRHELAVRLALGAPPRRLVGQCMAEAALLCGAGAAAGIVAGSWIARVLTRLAPPDTPRLSEVAVNGPVLGFTLALAALCTVTTGIVPALQAARTDGRGAARRGGRGVTSSAAQVRRWLTAGEVAVVVALLMAALLFVRTFAKLRAVDLGFETEHVMEVEARWPVGRLFQAAPGARPWPRVQRAVDGLVAAVDGIPGVEAVGLATEVPLAGDPARGAVWRADAPGAHGTTPPTSPRDRWRADLDVVTAGYFPAIGVTFLRGRNFTPSDRYTDDQLQHRGAPRAGVAIVNAAFAAQYFGGEDPVGRAIVLEDDEEFGPSRTIVGVVADVRGRSVAEAPVPAVFIPHAQHPDVLRPSLIVRSALTPGAVAAALRDRLAQYDPQLLVMRVRPMDAVVSGALSRPRFNLLLVGSFALLGLLLAAIGIYGVVSSLVAQRTVEIGIRMALGAQRADVLRLVLAEGMAPVAAGGIAGIAVALALTRSLRAMLFGVTPLDPISLAAAPAILAAVAVLACYLPARRATTVDPLVALRDD